MSIVNLSASNLYPPQVETFMPAAIYDFSEGNYRINFSITDFNSIDDIKYVIVSVANQFTNLTYLNPSKYPNEVMVKIPSQDSKGNKLSYIEIALNDLKGPLQLNQYYKVQLRFVGKDATNVPNQSAGISSWLNTNENYFSQWSTVCLIRGILKPELQNSYTGWDTTKLQYINTLIFGTKNSGQQDTLKSYKLTLLQNSNILQQTAVLYPKNINTMDYLFKYRLENGKTYIIQIDYTTNALYSKTVYSTITVTYGTSSNQISCEIAAAQREQLGGIQVNFYLDKKKNTQIYISRSSFETAFKYWQDIAHIIIPEDKIPGDFKWLDISAVPGVLYKYSIEQVENNNKRSQPIYTEQPVILDLQDMFLINTNGVLKIRFNPDISSFKYITSENITNTLGGKYPVVRRNGDNYYRQFNIGGLISCNSDNSEQFIDKNGAYSSLYATDYSQYNEKKDIDIYNDFIFERYFRQAVIDYLYKNNVKLFKSTTQGNILVKLTNITLTPEKRLGRRIYSFNAQATEIDDCSIDNYLKYKIIFIDTNDYQYLNATSILGKDGILGAIRVGKDGR